MTKRLLHELTYDAPPAAVAEMLSDPAFREKVCRYQGVTRVTVTISPQGEAEAGGKIVTVDQWQPTKGVPSVARKIVGDETNIVQQERWTSPTHGEISISIPGKPGDMSGTAVLVEKDGGTVETVDLSVKVNIPLVGGKLEGIISDLLLKALKAENKVGRQYLAR